MSSSSTTAAGGTGNSRATSRAGVTMRTEKRPRPNCPVRRCVHAAGGGDIELIRHGDVVPGQLERGPELPVAIADGGHREDAALAATARHGADGELLASDLVPAAGDDEGALVEEALLGPGTGREARAEQRGGEQGGGAEPSHAGVASARAPKTRSRMRPRMNS